MQVRGAVGEYLGGGGGSSKASNGDGDDDVVIVPTAIDALLSASQRRFIGPNLPAASRPADGPAVGAAASAAPAGLPPDPSRITTLRVKSEDGKSTYLLKCRYEDTIGTLRRYLDAHRATQRDGPRSRQYEIRSAFPPAAYSDLRQTLEAAGLVPNAALFLRSTGQ